MRRIPEFNLQRDPRKHILFVNDIFDGRFYAVLDGVKDLLSGEYHCSSCFKVRNPADMVMSIQLTCESEYLTPDLIVAYGSGATLAAQIKGIKKVLIKPFYHTSQTLAGMLGEKTQKTRIQLPTLGQPEYLTIIPPMITEWRKLETEAAIHRYNADARSVYFESDKHSIESQEEHSGETIILPVDNILDPMATEYIVEIIEGMLKE